MTAGSTFDTTVMIAVICCALMTDNALLMNALLIIAAPVPYQSVTRSSANINRCFLPSGFSSNMLLPFRYA